jgi:hypothetical protein
MFESALIALTFLVLVEALLALAEVGNERDG